MVEVPPNCTMGDAPARSTLKDIGLAPGGVNPDTASAPPLAILPSVPKVTWAGVSVAEVPSIVATTSHWLTAVFVNVRARACAAPTESYTLIDLSTGVPTGESAERLPPASTLAVVFDGSTGLRLEEGRRMACVRASWQVTADAL